MSDNEIVTALECFLELRDKDKCGNCVFQEPHDLCGSVCVLPTEEKLVKYALDLINRQKAEIEKLKNAKYIFATVDYCSDDLDKAHKEIEQLKHKYDLAVAEREANVKAFTEQIGKLTKENEVLKTNNHSMCLSMPNMAKAERSAAVKEFAERMKDAAVARLDFNGSTYFAVGLHHLDDLIEEFTEGE